MKGFVQQRGPKWYYKFRLPKRDPGTGRYPWITKGGFDTEREAWKACREAMRDVDRGRIVKPSTRTVSQFLTEWLAAVEPTFDPTTWRNWSDCARWYVVPQIGAEPLPVWPPRATAQAMTRVGARAAESAGADKCGRLQ
jgi:hypothetical protein